MLNSLTQLKGTLLERIKEGYKHDVTAQGVMEMIEKGKTRHFWLDNGVIYAKGTRVYVPKWDNLRWEILRECHNTKWAGYPGQHHTLALVEDSYFWPQMKDDVEAYVRTCLIHQQDKVDQHCPAGLLEPLPIPERPWESVSMDFVGII